MDRQELAFEKSAWSRISHARNFIVFVFSWPAPREIGRTMVVAQLPMGLQSDMPLEPAPVRPSRDPNTSDWKVLGSLRMMMNLKSGLRSGLFYSTNGWNRRLCSSLKQYESGSTAFSRRDPWAHRLA